MDDVSKQTIEQIKSSEDYFQKAKSIEFLQKEKGLTIKAISTALGYQPSYVCHIIRLNRVPEIIVDGYYSQLVTLSHLFMISRVKDEAKMIELYEKVLSENLSVIQTEYLVREALYDIKTEGERISKNETAELIEKISKEFKNVKVSVIQTRIKAKIQIEMNGGVSKTSVFLKDIISRLTRKSE